MSVFSEEWRRCLREHYQDVVRRNDTLTLRTLTPILYRVGFTEEELRNLYVIATMHVDTMPDDFVPSFEPLQEEQPATIALTTEEATFQAHPAECTCPACMDVVDEVAHDSDGQPLKGEALEEAKERASTPKQKTLF